MSGRDPNASVSGGAPGGGSPGTTVAELPSRGSLTTPEPRTLRTEVDELRERLRQAERKLRGIEAISRSLVSEHDLERVLELVVERTTRLLNAERSTLYLTDEDSTLLWSQVAQGGDAERIELKMGQGLAGWVAQHSKPLNVKDAYKDPRFDRSVDERGEFRTRSVLCWPLRNSRQKVIGVLQVLNKRDGYFTVADEDLLSAVASQAAIGIQNSKLYLDIWGKNIDLMETQQRLRERTAELELLFRIERQAAMALTLEQALVGTLEATLEDFPSEVAAVALLDEQRDAFEYVAAAGPHAERVVGMSMGMGATAAGGVLMSGEPKAFAQSGGDDLWPHLAEAHPQWEIRSMVCLPMVHKGQRLGCLQLINRTNNARGYSERDVRTLEAIAGRMALSVVLARAQEEEQKAERLAAIGQMLSGVVHDLKTPLTIINGYAQLMARAGDQDKRDHYKSLVQNQIGQIKAMTSELLAFARGDTKVLARKVHIDKFVGEIKELLTEELSGHDVELVLDVQFHGALRMDEGKMKRVVFNLARNAREAMDGGGRFTIRVEEDDGEVVFVFADTGPGIPDEMHGRLFESFATHGKKNGTGLGLAIVKKIVDEHGGRIDVRSAPDGGALFEVRLPQDGPAPAEETSREVA